MAETTKRPPLRFREGQVFEGYAFGRPITVRLDYPEWIDLDSAESFWSWHAITNLGGGASLAESELAEHWKLATSDREGER